MWSRELLDNLNIASFYLDVKNLEENLSQSDKDEIIRNMSITNNDLLDRLEEDIEEQNKMLKEILDRLDKLGGNHD